MKIFLRLLLLFVVPALLSGCAMFKNRTHTGGSFAETFRESLSTGNYRDGIWEGAAPGYRGPIRVRVSISGGQIQGIEIDGHREDPLVGGAAMEELLDLVLEYNSADLDAVSGATESSAGFLAAVEAALRSANAQE
jgi:fumarate reductase flavoprotein subunit